ncbi:MAG TPA: NAD-dependent epimerase/dehydratase family protein [Vicinamibacterales bacterium]|nr:NAD-dependent epimerase/dehydratase family protein [Vicinamibacterales bacterium]
MNVLVTGASGFIGHNVLLRAPRAWSVTAVYHGTPGLEAFVRTHGLAHVTPVRCDLTSAADVAEFARARGAFDACLYLAANGDPAKSAERPAWDLTLNTLALVTLLEHVRTGRLVYVSSGAVYDGLSGAVSPETPVAPRLPYAISKLASEHYVRAFAERGRTVTSYVNVRFFGAYGPYEPDRKITTKWLRAVVDGRREFVIRGNGENLIDFMYIDDAVDGFLALTSAPGWSGTVDFASGSPVSVNTVVETMARVLGADVTITHEGHTEEYIQFRSVDRTMRDRFGVAPSIAFEDGVRRLHAFLTRQSDGARQPA